jgi:hypothetical protein
LPEAELAALLPPFDPAEVKTGNIKDPEKIAAKIAEAEVSHRREFFERAALDPMTGRVLAIGVLIGPPHVPSASSLRLSPPGDERVSVAEATPCAAEFRVIANDDEKQLLAEFWDVCRGQLAGGGPLVGFNIFQFDLPFLIRRSWKHRVPVPTGLRCGRYWNQDLIDLREAWQLGDRQARGSLDSVAKHLGVGQKNGDGAEFSKLWASDRNQALGYLSNDLQLTARIGHVLGV